MAAGVTVAEVMVEVEVILAEVAVVEVILVLVLDLAMVVMVAMAITHTAATADGGVQVIMDPTGMVTLAALAEAIPISRATAIGQFITALAPILK